MEYDALILGLIIYLLLVGVLVIINESFCKAICLKHAQQANLGRKPPDVELNERNPKIIPREPILHQPTKTSYRQKF
ncbi:hypothetical protein B5X24_HaOG214226 [Helicoverpa armigera]|nr:hypothetical protein B5X24_HaOG214226 [Helicoverpa armigera]